jgi:hypothetical protein
MTLKQIRDAKDFDSLKPAMRFLCDNMQAMTYGEFQAYKRTLEDQCKAIGSSLKDMNEYAENYQIFG